MITYLNQTLFSQSFTYLFSGPMNYGICFCPKSKEEVLKTLGCADSKSLTDEKRQVILGKMCEETETLGWMVEAISPNNICRNMFRRFVWSLLFST